MANVTFPVCPTIFEPYFNETSSFCWPNNTAHLFVSENVTGNSTNETSSNEWQLPLGACIFLICDVCVSSTWIVTANLLVITSFFRDAKLRIIQNYYIVSLAVSDLMMGAFVLPLGLYSFLYAQGWPIQSKALCKFWNVLDFVNSLQSSLSVCLISYDRYKMVLYPINYRNEETPKRALMRIATTWTFSILFYGPVTLFWDIWQGYSILKPDECDVEFREIVWLTTLQACVEFGIPLVLICYCNIRLLMYIRKRRARMLEMRKALEIAHTDTTSAEHSDENNGKSIATVQKTMEKGNDKNKKKEEYKKNEAEIKEIKKEQRAARSLMILVGSYFILWFWYEMIGNFVSPICNCVPTEVYQASYWPQYHIPAINPLIYAITIERFRYHFLVFFSFLLPCWVRHPGKETARKNRIAPASVAAVHSASQAGHI